jgi:hypothetical protein
MQITSITEGGLAPDVVGVTRGMYSTSVVGHNAGRVVYRNVTFVPVRISDVQHEVRGTLATSLSSSEFESSGEVLAAAVPNTTVTDIEVWSTFPFFVDRTLLIGAEKMRVTQVLPGWMQDSGVTLVADVDVDDEVIAISNHSLLKVGWIVKLSPFGQEEFVRIEALTPGTPDTMTVERGVNSVPRQHSKDYQAPGNPPPPLVPNPVFGGVSYLTVTRGVDGTVPATHAAGAPIVHNVRTMALEPGFEPFSVGSHLQVNNEKFYALKPPDAGGTLKVIRGVLGTTFASHGAGATVTDVDGLGMSAITMTFSSAYFDYVLTDPGSHLTSSGRAATCHTLNKTAESVRVSCLTEQALPLGATGSGVVLDIGFRTFQTTGLSSTAVGLSNPEAADVSGDPYDATANGRNVIVVPCADMTGSLVVSATDISRVKQRFGMDSSHPSWDPKFDLRPDGAINATDIARVRVQFGTHCFRP